MRILGLVLLFALAATPVPAQRRADAELPGLGPLRVETGAPETPTALQAQPPSSPRGDRFLTRAATGGLGWLGGVFVGGVLGYGLLPRCTGCEDPGFEGLFLGAIAGSVIGTSALAAAPALGDGCRYGDRFGRAFLGTLGGSALGLLAALVVNHPAALPVTTSVAASAATLGCRGTTPEAGAAPAPPGS
ncbi:MAG TPA: hypothetical protein VHG28_18965 [Longimicrobiaceae bacterium]|nr:hypothetical protein [Longimicrobiaceae bacterium]